MAKKIKARRRRSRSVSARRRSSAPSFSIGKSVVAAGIYGAGRQAASSIITPVVAKVPGLGQYADEVGMIGVSYLAAKKGSGMLRDIGRAGLIIETAMLTSQLASGVLTTTAQIQRKGF